MKAAIYARYSSDLQKSTSLDDQVRLCQEEATRRGYAVAQVFTDAALPGTLDERQRPGFAAMLDAAKQRTFDVLITDEMSRLSRDQADGLKILDRLEHWGVGLVTRDGTDTVGNPNTRMVAGMKAVMADEENRAKAQRTWRGLQGTVLRGYSPGGLPYGYRSQPEFDGRGKIAGYRKVVHEGEAEIVRRIFRMFVGEEGGRTHSPREIVKVLNAERISPPGARWANRTKRQATSWSFTAITASRRLAKGILHNRLYVGKQLWNRSRWLKDPDTKRQEYRIRPREEWVETEVPELRIIPQGLWEKAQIRLALHDLGPQANPQRHVGKYLLSGFVRCVVCDGPFVKVNHSYRCATKRDRGESVCTNGRGVTVEKLERLVIDTLRTKLYSAESLRDLITHVRDELMGLAKRQAAAGRAGGQDRTRQLLEVEQEIRHIQQAVKIGKATASLLTMLEDAEQRRQALQAGQEALRPQDTQAKLARVLADLPDRVAACLEDLETLLREGHIEAGKQILSNLRTEILIAPDGTVEIRGDLRGALQLVTPKRGAESIIRWLGEEDSNPR